MNIVELEKIRHSLLQLQNEYSTSRIVLFKYSEYLLRILNTGNENFSEAYFSEFIDEYVKLLSSFDPSGIEPKIINNLLETAEKLLSADCFHNYKNDLISAVDNLSYNVQIIKDKLDGLDSYTFDELEMNFPVLEKDTADDIVFGYLEKISISIKRKSDLQEDSFLIFPSIGNIDTLLSHQIEISWNFAKSFLFKSSKKINNDHEVVIKFENNSGQYEGNSLGAAMSIGFIQELIKYYNLREIVTINTGIVSTGGIDIDGNISAVSKEIIKKKLKLVFYSLADIFIVPKEDEKFAEEEYKFLLEIYPKRKLNIVGVKNISEILNRRDLVSIQKQNLISWGSKKLIKNKVALFLVATLILLLVAYSYMSVDDNPTHVTTEGLKYIVKNKYGRVLWSIATIEDYSIYGRNKAKMINRHTKIVDIDDDGSNEVLMTRFGGENFNRLLLFNNKGEIIKKFSISYPVETRSEKFTVRYTIREISDVIETNSGKEVILLADHENYYPGLVLRLNLETFKVIGKPLVHSGHLVGVNVNDIDNDGKLELLCNGVSNGYRRAIFFVIEIDKLYGTSPATEDYKILNLPIAKFEDYLLLPKSDYCELVYPKYNTPLWPPNIIFNEKIISFGISETQPKNYFKNFAGYSLKFSYNLKNVDIVIGDPSVIERDRLVRSGKLNPPLTDTKEYRAILKRQIKKWNGKRFVQMFPDSLFTE